MPPSPPLPLHPLPPLLRLPPETLDSILSFLLPSRLSPRKQRKILISLLPVHPLLLPLIRRRLYSRVSLIVGDERERDEKLCELMDGGKSGHEEGGEGGQKKGEGKGTQLPLVPQGHHVKYLKLRLPDPSEQPDYSSLYVDADEDPSAAFLARPVVSQRKTVRRVTRLAESVKRARHIEWDLRAGTRFEELEGESGEEGGKEDEEPNQEELKRLGEALEEWKSVETFIYSVEDAKMRQQVFAAPSLSSSLDTFISPLAQGLQHFDALSALDLWRVQLVLPPPSTEPAFRLKILRLTQCTFGSQFELDWLLGAPGSKRTERLKRLSIDEVDFLSAPSSSAETVVSPLVTYLHALSFTLSFDSSDASPLTSLREFRLTSRHPLGPPGSASHLLSAFTSLETVELGGPGIGYDLFSSLFLPSFSSPSTLRLSEEARGPASTLRILLLTHLSHPSLPLPVILSFLTPYSPSSSTSTSTSSLPRPPPSAILPLALKELHLFTGFPLPRLLSWRVRRSLSESRWRPLASGGIRASEQEREEEQEAWEKVEGALRGLWEERRKGGKEGEGGGVRLWKNRLEIEYALSSPSPSSSSPASSHSSDLNSDADEEDQPEERPPLAVAAALDPNALWTPGEDELREMEEEREMQRRWLERNRRAEEEGEGEGGGEEEEGEGEEVEF
ncbi:hypothetical protein JCM8547_001340 [Rhodosporidiobolus lusitaniae]